MPRITKGWHEPSTPDKMPKTPWLTAEAVSFLESILEKDWTVIEHGGGGSTAWFAKRVKMVVTCEHDRQWFEALVNLNLANAVIMHWTIPQPPDTVCDLLFIDGEPTINRGYWIRAVHKIVKPGGWVVLDNANRREYRRERVWLLKRAELLATFTDPVGSFTVTEFYKWHG